MSTARHTRRSPFRIVEIQSYDPATEDFIPAKYKIKQVSMLDVLSHPVLEVSNIATHDALMKKAGVEDGSAIPDGLYDDMVEVAKKVEAELSPTQKAERQALMMEATLRIGMVRPRIATEKEVETALMIAADVEELDWTQLDDDDKADLDPMPHLSEKLVTFDYIKSDIVQLFNEIQKLSGLDAQSEQLAGRFRSLRKRRDSKEDHSDVSGGGISIELHENAQSIGDSDRLRDGASGNEGSSTSVD